MKIIKSSAIIKNEFWLQQALQGIEYAARISHRSEDGQTADSAAKFIQTVVIDRGDWSVVEHVNAQVEFVVDRGITHEIVRHRLFSYTQESTRFVNYKKKMPPTFIYPQVGVECPYCLSGDEPKNVESIWLHNAEGSVTSGTECSYNKDWLCAIDNVETAYKQLLDDGWRPQEARSVLPNALSSKILMTGNLRNWRHFFLMRTSKQAHPQMREVTIPLLAEFQKLVPVVFDDINPDASQIENVRKGN